MAKRPGFGVEIEKIRRTKDRRTGGNDRVGKIPAKRLAALDDGKVCIRLRVVDRRFPEAPKTAEELAELTPESGKKNKDSFAPMVVIADVNADGLGMCKWWTEHDGE